MYAFLCVQSHGISVPGVGFFTYCPVCGELVSSWGARRHECSTVTVSSLSCVEQAKRIVVQQAPVIVPVSTPTVADLEGLHDRSVVALPCGWACRKAKDTSRFDPAVKTFLKALYDEGSDPVAPRKWSPYDALDALTTSSDPVFTEEQLAKPNEDNIKSLFATWTRDKKKAASTVTAAATAPSDPGANSATQDTEPWLPPTPPASLPSRKRKPHNEVRSQ